MLFEPGNVRIIEYGDTVWRDVDDLIDRLRKRVERLVWQAVDQIEVNALESKFARPDDYLTRDLFRLHTIDRLLHLQVKILHAKTRAVESDLGKCLDMIAHHIPRIDLDTCLDVVSEIETLFNIVSNVAYLVRQKV